MTTEQKIEQAAENYSENWEEITGLDYEDCTSINIGKIDFITGAKSEAARNYWFEKFEKEKIEFTIEQLNKLDSILQSKYEILSNIQKGFLGKMKEGQLAFKKSGLKLAKEEIRRDIKELQQKLSEL